MQLYKKGDTVKDKSSGQVMTVKGYEIIDMPIVNGLKSAFNSQKITFEKSVSKNVICTWTDINDTFIENTFIEDQLEHSR